jgi:O-antigen ligase
MLEYLLFIFTVCMGIYRPAIALGLLLQIYVLRVAVSSEIDITCFLKSECNVDNSPLFGAILPVLVFVIITTRTFLLKKGKIFYQITLFDRFFFLNAILVIMGCMWSPDLFHSIDNAGRYLLIGIPYFYVARLYFQNTKDYREDLKTLLLTLYVISIMMTCLGVYYYIDIGGMERMTLPGSHPIPYSMMIGQGFLLACGVFFTGGKAIGITQSWFKITNLLMIFFFLFCQFLTNTRGVTVFMGMSVVILLIINLPKINFLKIIIAMPLMFGAFILILSRFDLDVLFARFNKDIQHDKSANERASAWQDCIEILGNNPILGVGTDGFKYYGDIIYPHNYFLEMAVSFGILGIILSVCMVLLFLFYAQFLSPKRGGTVEYQLVYVLALFYFLESNVSFTLWMHKGLYLWLGILMILPPILKHSKEHQDTSLN